MSKAEQVDIHAKVWFQREPWYLTEKKIKEGRMKDAGTANNESVGC